MAEDAIQWGRGLEIVARDALRGHILGDEHAGSKRGNRDRDTRENGSRAEKFPQEPRKKPLEPLFY